MPLSTTPYPQNPLASAIESIGQFAPMLLAYKKAKDMQAFKQRTLGDVLGFPQGQMLSPIPAQGPVTEAGVPPITPMIPSGTYPTAPAAMQPLMSKSVADIEKLSNALGPQMTNIFGGLGIGRGLSDSMQLQYNPDTKSFEIAPGTKNVSSKNANVIIRQEDVKNKRDISSWRDAVEKRLAKGQLAREEAIALRADSDLLGLVSSSNFDMLDPIIQGQLQSQAVAAINRLKDRGIKVYTGERAPKTTPNQPSTPAVPAPKVYDPAVRFNEIKASNPSLTDQQIYAQMAIEEASKQ